MTVWQVEDRMEADRGFGNTTISQSRATLEAELVELRLKW